MSDIVLELALKRSSGVLAGVVASLAQAGLELQSQKLDRTGSGWLTIHASGDAPDPGMLSERMAVTRGVERLMRLEVDGETVIADGELVVLEIENRIEVEDLAAFTISPNATGAAELRAEDGAQFLFDEPEAEPEHASEPEPVPVPEQVPEPEQHAPSRAQAEAAAALDDEQLFAEAVSDEFDDEPFDDDGFDDASDALAAEGRPARPLDPAERMQTAMRRRRRRRR